jgi:hypothetical protein
MRAALVILLAATAARAQGAPPPILGFPGTGSFASGDSRAIASEAGLYLNPALIAATHRFAIDAAALLGETSGDLSSHAFQISSVDSQSTDVAAGLGYAHLQSGNLRGSATSVAIGKEIASGFQLGVAAHWLDLHGRAAIDRVIYDAGAALQPATWLMLGVAVTSLNAPDAPAGVPLTFAGGVALGPSWLRASADLALRWPSGRDMQNAVTGGLSWQPAGPFVLRGGFVEDGQLGGTLLSCGAGVTLGRHQLDAAYRVNVSGDTHQSFTLGWKMIVTEL